jgi:hypothetical protein
MKLLEEQSLQGGDNLDNLLRAFFQAEMPNPWPSMESPTPRLRIGPPAKPDVPPGRTLVRSRLALAASVALLIAAPWFLGDKLTNQAGSGPSGDDPMARRGDPQGPLSHSHSTEELILQPDGTWSIHIIKTTEEGASK